MNYCVEFVEGYHWCFYAQNDKKACAEIALTLGITLPITKRKLQNRGVKRILRGGEEIPLETFSGEST
jgi:hypothetical protein